MAALLTCMHVFGLEHSFLVLLSRRLGMELLGHMVVPGQLLRNLQGIFHSSCPRLHPRQQSTRVAVFPRLVLPIFACFAPYIIAVTGFLGLP